MTPEHNIPTLDTLTNTTVMDRVSPHSTPQCNDGSNDEQEHHLTLLLCYVNTSPQTQSECGFAVCQLETSKSSSWCRHLWE